MLLAMVVTGAAESEEACYLFKKCKMLNMYVLDVWRNDGL